MTIIECEAEEFWAGRQVGIKERLSRVSDRSLDIEIRPRQDICEITASYGGAPSSSTRDWTFPSIVDSVVCHYRELWIPIELTQERFRLEHILFHLLQDRGPDESPKEIVAFHWHPTTSVEGREHSQSHRPHLHLTAAPDPLPRSHLGVTLTVAMDDQATVEYLDSLLDEAIRMIAAEVLNLYDSAD